jgi:cytochrome c
MTFGEHKQLPFLPQRQENLLLYSAALKFLLHCSNNKCALKNYLFERGILMFKALRTALFVLAAGLMPFVASAAPSKQDAQTIVEKAAAFATTNGNDKLIAEVNKKDGQFNQGELYVFVYDLEGTLIADPVNSNMLGQNNLAKPDADGKLFRKEFVEIAKSQGKGWVDYKFANPVSGKVEPKASYVLKQGNVIIIAGVYLK